MAVFNEDTRVKIPATIQFLRLGYEYQSLKDIDLHTETRIAINRFKPALESINGRSYNDAEISAILDEIHSVIRNNDMGRAFYRWLINPQDKPVLVDFEHIENNDFAVVDELTFGKEGSESEKEGSFRPDITILINGIPLCFLEVKHPNNEGGIQAEFTRMLNKRLEKPEYKKYFNMLQVVSFSNNMEYEDEDDSAMAEDVKAGSFYTTPNGSKTTFSFFREESPKTIGFVDISMDKIKAVLKDNHYSPTEADTPEFYTNLDMNIFDGDVVFSHHVNVIRTDNEYLKYYLLYLFNSDYFHKYISGHTNGTNILGLSFNGVEDYHTEIPSGDLLEAFGKRILEIEKKKSEIFLENEQLASLRDFLLPMLMNGQVKVNTAGA